MADTDDTMTDTDDTCQSPRQNAKVNLLAKLPMSIPWPNAPPTSPSLLLLLVVPVQDSFKIVQPWNT